MSLENQPTKSTGSKFVWVGLVIVILIGVGVWGALNFTSLADSVDAAAVENVAGLEPAPVTGHPAPDFTLRTLDGQAVSLSDFQGQPVIINFWATWCGPCRVEMPHLQEAYTAHRNDVVILGVNLTERDNPDDVPGFVEEFGLTFPILFDEDGQVANEYKAFGQPASIFVDEAGVVHTVFYGPVNRAFIDARISELLAS